MKKARRAAAVWMTMSLALSTIFGSTAWGEVIQETGKNRCTHVHTAECYGNPDETATPSEIGELEPTECTHVCSVESGCILDTEDKKTEDISSEDQELSDGKASDNEILDDREVPSVNTPSNAKDNTSTINGTTMPSSKTKVHSWTWYDPEGILIDGKLELTGVTEEAQPSFEEITEYLPQAIIAQVGDSEAWEEENLQLENWTCAEYVQDENGLWPLEGNYEFTAELPEGYELADGADALVVEVSVAGDQTAVMSDVWYLTIRQNGTSKDVKWDSEKFQAQSGDGWSVTQLGANEYQLTLTDANLNKLYFQGGNWRIVLNGNNTLDGAGTYIALEINSGNITIDGNGSLKIDSRPLKNANGISVGVNGSLTIMNGTINASASGNFSDTSAAILVNGKLKILGGEIIAKASGKYAVLVGGASNAVGEFSMSGGRLEATGAGRNVFEVNRSSFTLSGGTIIANSTTNGFGFVSFLNPTTIEGDGRLETSKLVLTDGASMTVGNKANLIADNIVLKGGGSLENNGQLELNGAFEDNGGTFINNGTISGNGTLPDGVRQDPGAVNVKDFTLEQKYSAEKIDVQSAAGVTAPNQYVKLFYSIDEDESTGIGTINSETGKLTVEKAGIFKIKVKTLATGVYIEGTPVEITLTVNKADFPDDWKLTVSAVNKVYDGKAEAPATITSNSIPENVNVSYQYQLAAASDVKLLGDNWDSSLTVKDVADSYKYVFVRVVTDNYKSKIFGPSQPIEISRRTFKDVGVTITPDTVSYNGDNWEPKIKVTEDWSGASGDEVDSSGYKIYWTNEKGNIVELKDAGTYTAHLMGTIEGNYSSELKTVSFTIEKCKLKSQMEGGPLVKVYDGTTNISEEQNLSVKLYSDSGVPNLQDIRADKVKWAYRSADVGEHYIDATIITLAGDKKDNYEVIQWTSSLLGTITAHDFESMTVSATPLTYDGTGQKPQINVSVDTGLDTASGSNAKFSYSMDGKNFESEVPGFKDPGTYTVHVKAEMDNFNPITDTVEVIVQKAAAPTVAGLSETYSYKETGEKRVKFTGIPEDCGTLGAMTAQIVSDEGQILDGSATVDGSELVFKLKGSSKGMIGKTAQIVVAVETQNYENIEIPVTVTLKADPSDNDDNSGNGGSGNNNSGSNSGNSGSGNGNSGSGSSNGNNSGNSGSSSSGSSSDDSDYNDSKTTAPKLSDVRSGNAANNAANNVTKDSKKGYQSNSQGVITGADNQVTNDGYSHWMKDSKGWWLRYSDGSYPMGSAGEYHWEKINGRWWAFGPDGYLSTGWIYDTAYQGWFYMDANQGMLTGWQFIDGKWYYLNPVSDGTCGIMYAKKRTPDGWLVKEDGSWDEEAGR